MINYKISFDFDIEKALNNYDESQLDIDILEIKDDRFSKEFNTKNKIKDFENWYNTGASDEEKVIINDIKYESEDLNSGVLLVNTESELQEPKDFASELVDYLFDGGYPEVHYHVHGCVSQDAWDYNKGCHSENMVRVDDEDWESLAYYNNLNIIKI